MFLGPILTWTLEKIPPVSRYVLRADQSLKEQTSPPPDHSMWWMGFWRWASACTYTVLMSHLIVSILWSLNHLLYFWNRYCEGIFPSIMQLLRDHFWFSIHLEKYCSWEIGQHLLEQTDHKESTNELRLFFVLQGNSHDFLMHFSVSLPLKGNLQCVTRSTQDTLSKVKQRPSRTLAVKSAL